MNDWWDWLEAAVGAVLLFAILFGLWFFMAFVG